MARLTSQLQRLSRPLKIGIQVGVLAVILAAVGTVGFVEYSAQPGFCTTCHLMQPYYDSWATSSHNDVPCIKCHYAPGIKAEAMGKLQAANQVVKYVTGAYGTKPWAEIEDAACLRSGCHSLRKVEGVVSFHGVRFDHAQHLGELRRGKQLRCTSCHSQIVQVDNLAVEQTTCNLCHFKERDAGEPLAGCIGCHRSPPRVVSAAGFVVDHEQYVEDLVPCVSCHQQVTEGSGAAEEARCWNCHNVPERIEQFEHTTLLHRVHIAEHNLECTQCHLPIEHRMVALAESAELDCATCHQRVHEAQQQLFSGMGGHGVENQPSSMFLARVSCAGCHELTKSVGAHETVRGAGEASCLSCHGIGYANILPEWQRQTDQKVQRVEGRPQHRLRRRTAAGEPRARARGCQRGRAAVRGSRCGSGSPHQRELLPAVSPGRGAAGRAVRRDRVRSRAPRRPGRALLHQLPHVIRGSRQDPAHVPGGLRRMPPRTDRRAQLRRVPRWSWWCTGDAGGDRRW